MRGTSLDGNASNSTRPLGAGGPWKPSLSELGIALHPIVKLHEHWSGKLGKSSRDPNEEILQYVQTPAFSGENEESPILASAKPEFEEPRYWIQVEQEWDGVVLSVGSESIEVELRDAGDDSAPKEIAEIGKDHISPRDLGLVEEGAMFTWSIGFRTESHGQKSLSSSIRFRRMPPWSEADLDRARKLGSRFRALLDGEDGN